uniref:P/Homo B domain-containing protein n=1 Tax=Aureoumbra lagunensis TaxID=44058 RepID=A0A7S3JQ65_9STRA
MIEVFVTFELAVIVLSTEPAYVLMNSGGRAVWDGDESAQTTIRFLYQVEEGDKTPALDVLNATALRGNIRRYATPEPITAANLTLPICGETSSISDTSERVKIDTTAPYISSLFALKRPSTYVAGETIYIVARFTTAVVVNESAISAGLIPKLGLSVVSTIEDDSEESSTTTMTQSIVATLMNGTRDTQPFDAAAEIPYYDLPFRCEVYDLVFRYDVEPGHTSSKLAHSGRGALYIEDYVEFSINETIIELSNKNQSANGSNATTYKYALSTNYRMVSMDAGAAGVILRGTNGQLITRADTTLKSTEELKATIGRAGSVHVEQQWRGGDTFAARVEIALRGASHPYVNDLAINISHANVSVPLFGPGEGGSRSLGRGTPPDAPRTTTPVGRRTGTPITASTSSATARDRWGGEHGADYLFSDLSDSLRPRNNIAPLGIATQSSTDHEGVPERAIDGNVDPFFTHESCTHTANEFGQDGAPPWFHLQFNRNIKDVGQGSEFDDFGTIKIWNREPLENVIEVQSVAVLDFLTEPSGDFRLSLNMGKSGVLGISGSNGSSYWMETGQISATAPASVSDELALGVEYIGSSVQAKVMRAWPQLGTIGVSRYKTDEPSKGGYIYMLTFHSYAGDLPMLSANPTNLTGHKPVIQIEEVLKGSPSLYYSFDADQTAITGKISDTIEQTAGLYPLYVMLFDQSIEPNSIPPTLIDALELACWSIRLEDQGERERTIDVDPARFRSTRNGPISGLRLQLEDESAAARLSFAEIQIFVDREETVRNYNGGGLIATLPWTAPYQSRSTLNTHFGDGHVDGVWTLIIRDENVIEWYAKNTRNQSTSTPPYIPYTTRRGRPGPIEAHGQGQVADWVLLLTDEAGITQSYFMDLTATVTALPKYGQLFADASSLGQSLQDGADAISPNKYIWADQLTTSIGQLQAAGRDDAQNISIMNGHERPLGPCYGVDTTSLNGVASGIDGFRYCGQNYGVGNAMVARYRRSAGSDAAAKRLRRQRVVYYHPIKNYIGIDSFQFTIELGPYSSIAAIAEDNITTSESTGIVGLHVRKCRRYELDKRTQPERTVSPLCPCLPTEIFPFVSDLDSCRANIEAICTLTDERRNWQRLCRACVDDGDTTFSTTFCYLEIERATTLIAHLGSCDDTKPADCRFELITADGPEPYMWTPSRTALITPHPEALRPLGTANPGDGFGLPS